MAKKLYQLGPNDWVTEPSDGADEFNPLTGYVVENWVSYNCKKYVCKKNTTAGTLPTDTTYWNDMSSAPQAFSQSNKTLVATVEAIVPAVALKATETSGEYELEPGAANPWDNKASTISCGTGVEKITCPVANGDAKVDALFSGANTLLMQTLDYVVGASGNPEDRTVRTLGTLSAATTITIAAPRAAGKLRDFAVTFTEPSTAVGVTFSTTDAGGNSLTFYGEFLSPSANNTYIYYLTEIAANTFLVKGEQISTVTPPTI